MTAIFGLDVGGTFTDLVRLDPERGALTHCKVPSTPLDQSCGVMSALQRLWRSDSADAILIHGTTVGTNAILERRGSTSGLITTRGFRDVLELGRRTRPQLYGLHGTYVPLIPRALRLEVAERICADGTIAEPLAEAEVEEAARELLAKGAEAVVVGFLHSVVNPVHERRARAILERVWPNPHITLASEVLPENREFERLSAAAVNAYVQPIMGRYLGALTTRLREVLGMDREVLVMQGNGGILTAGLAVSHSVHTVLSGPAAGVTAAAAIGRLAGCRNLITCDMGGTSFDVGLVLDGRPGMAMEKHLSYGVPLRIPMLDIHTIGLGGGSIASVNVAGILEVGPKSAGADPGPMCYDRGGDRPTITDANVLLGRIDPDRIASTCHASLPRVAATFRESLGAPLSLDEIEAAVAVIEIAEEKMASALELMLVDRGHDPQDFVIVAFGGAGPLHAVSLARKLNLPEVLIPALPGNVSALGCVMADVRHDFLQAFYQPVDGLDLETLRAIMTEHVERGRRLLADQGLSGPDEVRHSVDMLYEGQTHVLEVPIAKEQLSHDDLLSEFADRFFQRFGIRVDKIGAHVATVRTTVSHRPPHAAFDFAALLAQGSGTDRPSPRLKRRAWLDGEWMEVPVYWRPDLAPDARIAGPALIEESHSATVVPPGSTAVVDGLRNLRIKVG